jgi:LysR family transcriptional regulator, nod-box dependent transcriptional activator
MHLNRFDLNLLIALDALLQEKNVTRAAERVFVSQPAMSGALQKLRDYFNDPLLIRAGREMQLTPRGLSLIEPVREALLRIQATLGTQPSFDTATAKRDFSVVAQDYAIPRLAPRVLKRLLQEAPGVRCAIEELTRTSLSRLEYGDIDICVMIDNPRIFDLRQSESLRIAELMPIRWVCVVSSDHPTIGDELTEDQYRSCPHLVGILPGASAAAIEVPLLFSSRGLDVRITAHSLLELPFMLPGTPLIATVPESVAKRFQAFPVKFFAPPIDIHDSREVMVWHKRSEADPGHAWLRGLFVEAAKEI